MLSTVFIKTIFFLSLTCFVYASDTVDFFNADVKELVEQLQTPRKAKNDLEDINSLNPNEVALLWSDFMKKKEAVKKAENPDCDISSFDEDEIVAIWEDYINRQMLQN